MTELFNNGFEEGDFSAWTSTTGTPTIVSDWVHHGTYSEFVNSAEYASETLTDINTVFGRAYVKFSTLPTSNAYRCSVLSFHPSGFLGYPIYATAYKDTADSLVKWAIRNHYNNTWAISDTQVQTGVEYLVELKYTRNGANVLYLDGVELVSGANSPNIAIVQFSAGSPLSHQGSVWIDCVVVGDAYIGPEAAAGLSIPVAMHHYGHLINKIIRG